MKRNLQKLKKIKCALDGIEVQLDMIEKDLITIDSNLDHLRKMEEDMVYNIELLKNKKTIPIVSQYRQSTAELNVIRKNIIHYENMKKRLAEKMVAFLKSHKSYTSDYNNLKREMDDTKVILLFDSKRKKK